MDRLILLGRRYRRWLIPIILVAVASGWGLCLRYVKGMVWADTIGFQDKTLWDWMELLVVPVVLAIVAYFFNQSERKSERENIVEQQRAEALQAYLDRISDLLLDKGLQEAEKGDILRVVGRSLTLAVLQRLDGSRKRIALGFLYNANLIKDRAIISLKKADLSEVSFSMDLSVLEDPFLDKSAFGGAAVHELILPDNLSRIDLRGANLSKANFGNVFLYRACLARTNLTKSRWDGAKLVEVDLSSAVLMMSNFEEAVLNKADFSKATIIGTNLSKAELQEANFAEAFLTAEYSTRRKTVTNLSGADLMNANLSGALLKDVDLRNANLCGANLEGAKFEGIILRGAKYDGNTRWPTGFTPPHDAVRIA